MVTFLCVCYRVNQAMFTGSSSIDSYASGKEILHVNLPSISAAEGNKMTNVEKIKTDCSHVRETAITKFDQKMPDLITLSLLPKTQWQSLINLDIIKVLSSPC